MEQTWCFSTKAAAWVTTLRKIWDCVCACVCLRLCVSKIETCRHEGYVSSLVCLFVCYHSVSKFETFQKNIKQSWVIFPPIFFFLNWKGKMFSRYQQCNKYIFNILANFSWTAALTSLKKTCHIWLMIVYHYVYFKTIQI